MHVQIGVIGSHERDKVCDRHSYDIVIGKGPVAFLPVITLDDSVDDSGGFSEWKQSRKDISGLPRTAMVNVRLDYVLNTPTLEFIRLSVSEHDH